MNGRSGANMGNIGTENTLGVCFSEISVQYPKKI